MFGIRYEVRTALRISVWFGTVVTVQALLRTLLQKLRYLLRRVVTLVEDMRAFESVYLTF